MDHYHFLVKLYNIQKMGKDLNKLLVSKYNINTGLIVFPSNKNLLLNIISIIFIVSSFDNILQVVGVKVESGT